MCAERYNDPTNDEHNEQLRMATLDSLVAAERLDGRSCPKLQYQVVLNTLAGLKRGKAGGLDLTVAEL